MSYELGIKSYKLLSPCLLVSLSPPPGCATCYKSGNPPNAVAYHPPISPSLINPFPQPLNFTKNLRIWWR